MLNDYQLILASGSPRRKELFSLLGLKPLIIPADVPEPITAEQPHIQAMKHAQNKAEHVMKQIIGAPSSVSSEIPKNKEILVVAADTLVAIDSLVLGKPKDDEEAKAFLRILAAKDHEVYTGICISLNDTVLCDYECTRVSFASLSESEIATYISTGEPFDKAGAYGIQGYGAQFISKVEGCYFNVMGFPIRKFYDLLKLLLNGERL
ncbi:MAG: septum formation protein Maf [Candidatus Cloacimonetes bacterium HGW-Cloacimonetes-3]|nr:MAG: septum formation protein Maf [Candidatus Cloacimonetes bacterium HGW-Cloacimonetes-3]